LLRHDRFAERVFTAGERAYCESRPDPAPHFAARFAAKEAALKALGLGIQGLGVDAVLQGVEVVREEGPPRLLLTGRAQRRARELGVRATALSLAHDGDTAIASVVMWAGTGGA
jgi:holo-[acyl-carrier protein] synthase